MLRSGREKVGQGLFTDACWRRHPGPHRHLLSSKRESPFNGGVAEFGGLGSNCPYAKSRPEVGWDPAILAGIRDGALLEIGEQASDNIG